MRTLASLALLALLAAAPAVAAPVVDDTARGQQLDQLFQDLKTAISPADGVATEQKIMRIWLASGDASIDRQMGLIQQAIDTRDYSTALKALNTIIINRPDYVEAWNKRATLYYIVGNYQESLNDIAKTLTLEPRHFGAIAGKGEVYLKLGQDDKALEAFKQALAVDPQLTNIQMQIDQIEKKTGRQRI